MPPAPTRDDTIAKLRDVWTSITGLVTTLDAADWDLPTDCPGWTVRDQLAHLLTFEEELAGHPTPADDLPDMPAWVHNDIGKANERAVHHWRSRPVTEMLEAWTRTVDERLAQLSAASDADLAADSWTPLGPGTVLDLMQVRILDHWLHEQDIRRATARPGHESGPAAEHTIDRLLAGIPMVVGKRAAAPEGTSVVVELTGPITRERTVTVSSGRAHPSTRPTTPTVILRMPSTTYAELAAGRTQPTQAQVTWTGDDSLAQKITTSLTIMP
ncbi:MAG TPA: maleylpyruvate isomerase family mycothiol-dependent enzyme [Streptosporangiaceae bacterium]